MFLIRKKAKNTSVSATLVSSTSPPPPVPQASSPSNKPTTSSNRFSRFTHHPTTTTAAAAANTATNTTDNMVSSSSPDMKAFQSIPEDSKSYQSFSYSASHHHPRSPSAISPGGPLSHSNRNGIRKSRQIPTFNLMVIGAKTTGKSTFLHTLVGSLTPSLPTQNDLPAISVSSTSSLSEKLISIVTLSGEKVMLNLIDTPGLDILSNGSYSNLVYPWSMVYPPYITFPPLIEIC
jgi:ribosome biogenesis GTPase A